MHPVPWFSRRTQGVRNVVRRCPPWLSILASEALWLWIELLPVPSARAEWHFVESSAAHGLAFEHGFAESNVGSAEWSSGGVAAGDYDGDGWTDLYVVGGSAGSDRLLHNRGDGTFEERTTAAGINVRGQVSAGASFVDFDGDGHLDLFVGAVVCPPKVAFCDGEEQPQRGRIYLFRNRGDGTFADVTEHAGIRVTRDTFSASWADVDGDGDLDLFLAHWGEFRPPGSSEHLWRNNGDGTFTDVSIPAGITAAYRFVTGEIGDMSFTGNFADIDSDGWLDLLVAGDFRQSKVFRNLGGGIFAETTGPEITDENGMGAAVGDYDNDGDLDWFVTSIWDPDQDAQGGNWYVSGNRLYRNRGDGSFEDVTDLSGVRAGYWGWAATFADLDNDGWLDLFHVNGWRLDEPGAWEFHADPSRLFVNQADGRFVERATELGIDDRGQGRAVVAFDADRDGDLDLLVGNIAGPLRFYRNEQPPGNFLSVRLRGSGKNSQGVGARLWVRTGESTQLRELRCGNNFLSQDPVEAHFGLGSAQTVDELRVRWPDGKTQRWSALPANAWVTIQEGSEELAVFLRASPTASPTATPSLTGSATVSPTVTPTAPSPRPTEESEIAPSPTATAPSPAFPTASPTRSPTPTVSATSCVGDCNGDGSVTVDEIVALVRLALGLDQPAHCSSGLGSGQRADVDITLVICAVRHALYGCADRATGCPG